MAIKGEGSAFTLARCKDEAAWLAERRKGVGGSDVAAIMGLSKYKAPYQLWAEKSGLSEPEDLSEKEAVRWGNILEPVIGARYAELHPDREVRRVNAICRSVERPWAQASLDYEVRDPDLGWGVLEIKTVGWRSMRDWDDGVPLYYQTQVAHYLAVTDRPFADVAVLKAGQEYAEYRVMRDKRDEMAVNAAVDTFWCTNVLKGIPPEISASGGDAAALLAASEPSGGEEEASFDSVPELADWLLAKEHCDHAKASLEAATNRLKARIGSSESIATEEGRVTWRRVSRQRFDSKRFKKEHPGDYDSYSTVTLADGGLRWTPAKEGER